MIVSHLHRFVFIKTRKTAGSSIEAALAPYLGPDDIVTGSESEGLPRQNCPDHFTEHVRWWQIHELIGESTFLSYRRFCVERNPWDKTVSDWLYHRDVLHDTQVPLFSHAMFSAPTDWERYTQNDRPVCQVIQFDDLIDGFARICLELELPLIHLPMLKVNTERMTWQHYHDEDTKRVVRQAFKKEIDHFGYHT